ncbi:hypothetical protein Tco_1350117 [Tanacetum coccineum]
MRQQLRSSPPIHRIPLQTTRHKITKLSTSSNGRFRRLRHTDRKVWQVKYCFQELSSRSEVFICLEKGKLTTRNDVIENQKVANKDFKIYNVDRAVYGRVTCAIANGTRIKYGQLKRRRPMPSLCLGCRYSLETSLLNSWDSDVAQVLVITQQFEELSFFIESNVLSSFELM